MGRSSPGPGSELEQGKAGGFVLLEGSRKHPCVPNPALAPEAARPCWQHPGFPGGGSGALQDVLTRGFCCITKEILQQWKSYFPKWTLMFFPLIGINSEAMENLKVISLRKIAKKITLKRAYEIQNFPIQKGL